MRAVDITSQVNIFYNLLRVINNWMGSYLVTVSAFHFGKHFCGLNSVASYLFIISQPLVEVASQNQEVLLVHICGADFCQVPFVFLEFWYNGTRSNETNQMNG